MLDKILSYKQDALDIYSDLLYITSKQGKLEIGKSKDEYSVIYRAAAGDIYCIHHDMVSAIRFMREKLEELHNDGQSD